MNKMKGGGIGITTLLTVVFVVLKLCKVITWSWWWVLSPLWIVASLIILLWIIYLVICLIDAMIDKRKSKK